MRITKKRFAGRTFNAVQIIPVLWRLKWLAIFAVPAVVLFYFYPDMYAATKGEDGSSLYYIVMLIPVLLALAALSRGAQRVVVYVDPEDKNFVVISAGLLISNEKLNTPISKVTGVNTETKVVYDKSEQSGDTVRKTRTSLVVNTGKGTRKLWTYSRAAGAQKAARLVEQLLKD